MNDDGPWLTGDETLVWLHLQGMMWAVGNAVDAQLKHDASLNYFEYSVLVGLSSRPARSMQMSQLAQWANGSPSRLSHAVSRLEKSGWVERRQCPGEPGRVEAVMTEAGWEKLVATAPGHVREVRRTVFDPLTPAEQAQFSSACRKILEASAPGGLGPIDEAVKLVERRSSP